MIMIDNTVNNDIDPIIITIIIISPHGIAMLKGLYFTTVFFPSSFSTPNLLGH